MERTENGMGVLRHSVWRGAAQWWRVNDEGTS